MLAVARCCSLLSCPAPSSLASLPTPPASDLCSRFCLAPSPHLLLQDAKEVEEREKAAKEAEEKGEKKEAEDFEKELKDADDDDDVDDEEEEEKKDEL